MLSTVGASDIAAFLVAASCICAAVFLILREKYRRAMLTEKSGDDAPRDRADGLWLPSDFGDQPNVDHLSHNGTFYRKGVTRSWQ